MREYIKRIGKDGTYYLAREDDPFDNYGELKKNFTMVLYKLENKSCLEKFMKISREIATALSKDPEAEILFIAAKRNN